MPGIQATYLGMPLQLADLDHENLDYFRHCAAHDFHLQACAGCGRLRYPPTTACPWCMTLESTWRQVEGKGAVHSYTEVHHAIQPAFREHTPYMVLLVDLDTQKGEPTPDEALRVIGNLCTPDGRLAPPDMVKRVGIGTRVRMVFADVGEGLVAAAMDDRRDRDAAGKCVALSTGIALLSKKWAGFSTAGPRKTPAIAGVFKSELSPLHRPSSTRSSCDGGMYSRCRSAAARK